MNLQVHLVYFPEEIFHVILKISFFITASCYSEFKDIGWVQSQLLRRNKDNVNVKPRPRFLGLSVAGTQHLCHHFRPILKFKVIPLEKKEYLKFSKTWVKSHLLRRNKDNVKLWPRFFGFSVTGTRHL